ncbi:translation initiation factor IF-2 [Vallitalea okinawensis]|uniref:translation initiation factor IF-2 n=1 Tax=Vallitalea okinawensis TaxID=2078660 RepID=UPI000CFDADEF|nr:translation initiation factor IF-2 [Vallitalea okinawensis]
MSKVRVYEIAKQLNISSKDVIKKLSDFNIDVHSHMSSLTDTQVNKVVAHYKSEHTATTEKKVNKNNNNKESRPQKNMNKNSSEEKLNNSIKKDETNADNNATKSAGSSEQRTNDNRSGNYNNRTNDNRTGNYNNRNNDNRSGNYNNRNNDNRSSNYNNRNNDNRSGNYNNRNNDNRSGNYNNRNNDNRSSNYNTGNNDNRGYNNRNNDNRGSNYNNRNNDNRVGSYNNRNNDNRSGNYNDRNNDNRGSNYNNRNNDNRGSNYSNRNNDNRSSNYNNRNNDNRNNDNRSSNYNNRNNDNRSGNYNNRNNDNRSGNYNNRNNDNRSGNYNNRNNDNRSGNYNNRNNDNRSGNYNNRNNDNRGGNYNNRNNDNRGGNYNNRNNDNRGGNYNNRNNDNRSGNYNNRNNDNRGGNYNNRNNDNRSGNYNNRSNDNRGGNYNNRGGGNYNNRSNDNRSGGNYNNRNNNNRNQKGGFNDIKIKTDSYNKPATNANANTKSKKSFTDKSKDKKTYNNNYGKPFKGFEKPSKKKNKKHYKKIQERQPEVVEEIAAEDLGVVAIPERIVVKDLAERLHKPSSDIVKYLMLKGIMATLNQEVDFALAEEIAMEFDILVEKEEEVDLFEEYFNEEPDASEDLKERPPVVVVMGHVDHGKTSLLDAIRETNITEKEAGGITQHIGASVVKINEKNITFLDTPGHEAFTAMRMRGAQVTDIAILVVAADDGVMPQTIEAINHAKAAEVQIIVAINKMDKPGANPDRVKQELSEHGLVPEDWGGDTICVPVSAITREGLDQLLEMIIIVSELEELNANPDRLARGSIVEAKLDKGRGTVATILVQNGSINVGDAIVAGSAYGRVRAMMDDKGRRVKTAGPSTPVEILGLSEVPIAGDRFFVTKNDKEARLLAEMVVKEGRLKLIQNSQQKVSLDDLFNQIQAGNVKELNIVVKADTQGSVEAVKQSLEKLSNEEVVIRPIHGGVGAVTESDVLLASASNAIIIGFNVRPDAGATSVAETEGVDIRLYRIIYNAIEDIEAAMKGMLDPEFKEKVIGHVEIRETFKVSGVGTIGGAYVTDGKILRNSQVRIVRDGIVVHEGLLASLKRFKDDVKEVNTGYECGVMIEKFNDIKIGDQVEAFIMEEIPR